MIVGSRECGKLFEWIGEGVYPWDPTVEVRREEQYELGVGEYFESFGFSVEKETVLYDLYDLVVKGHGLRFKIELKTLKYGFPSRGSIPVKYFNIENAFNSVQRREYQGRNIDMTHIYHNQYDDILVVFLKPEFKSSLEYSLEFLGVWTVKEIKERLSIDENLDQTGGEPVARLRISSEDV